MKEVIREGVVYRPFSIRFRTTDGKRHVTTLWAPELFAIRDTLFHYLDDRGDVDASKPIVVQEKTS